jgi:hypothetical protein
MNSGKPPGEFACANYKRRPREDRRSWREYLYWKVEVRARELDLERGEVEANNPVSETYKRKFAALLKGLKF